MDSTTIKNIAEIAEQLDMGFRACVHKTTGQVLFVPNELDMPDIDLTAWEEELEILDDNFIDYYEVEKWTSREAYDMMADFAEELTGNKQLQDDLFYALAKKKPFREFKFVIDGSGSYRQQWFDFKKKWQQDYVKRQLSMLMQADE